MFTSQSHQSFLAAIYAKSHQDRVLDPKGKVGKEEEIKLTLSGTREGIKALGEERMLIIPSEKE